LSTRLNRGFFVIEIVSKSHCVKVLIKAKKEICPLN
jgi:hypothetical protein